MNETQIQRTVDIYTNDTDLPDVLSRAEAVMGESVFWICFHWSSAHHFEPVFFRYIHLSNVLRTQCIQLRLLESELTCHTRELLQVTH